MKRLNLSGHRSGRLLVLNESIPCRAPSGHLYYKWKCRCDCGNEVYVATRSLSKKLTKSCGCYMREISKKNGESKIHGMAGTPTYNSWRMIIQRCNNKNKDGYERYGGRGISFCKRWEKFENFLEDMGERPSEKHSIDRIDVNDDYKPSNCKWSLIKEQCRNRRSNTYIVFNGKKKCISEWSEITGLNKSTIRCRLVKGLKPSDVLAPVKPSMSRMKKG